MAAVGLVTFMCAWCRQLDGAGAVYQSMYTSFYDDRVEGEINDTAENESGHCAFVEIYLDDWCSV